MKLKGVGNLTISGTNTGWCYISESTNTHKIRMVSLEYFTISTLPWFSWKNVKCDSPVTLPVVVKLTEI